MKIWIPALTALVAFGAAAGIGAFAVPYLRRLKLGQHILEIGPNWHLSKEGTPTMGGIIFVSAALLVSLPAALIFGTGDWKRIFCVLFLALFNCATGLLDDCEKILKKRNLGLKAKQKLIAQFASGALFLALCTLTGVWTGDMAIPFTGAVITGCRWLTYPLALVLIVGVVNAVNLTDGVDGLATGVTLPVTVFFALSARVLGQNGLSLLAAGITGALCGFLIYNFNPAKVFMGDTGSLFLGGTVVAMAFALGSPLVILIVGIVYILEDLSDIIQVSYFKLTHGKRVFKMAPIHHHFELCGWSEKKIFFVFSALSLLGCAGTFLWILC